MQYKIELGRVIKEGKVASCHAIMIQHLQVKQLRKENKEAEVIEKKKDKL